MTNPTAQAKWSTKVLRDLQPMKGSFVMGSNGVVAVWFHRKDSTKDNGRRIKNLGVEEWNSQMETPMTVFGEMALDMGKEFIAISMEIAIQVHGWTTEKRAVAPYKCKQGIHIPVTGKMVKSMAGADINSVMEITMRVLSWKGCVLVRASTCGSMAATTMDNGRQTRWTEGAYIEELMEP